MANKTTLNSQLMGKTYGGNKFVFDLEEGFNQNSKPDLNKNVIQSFLVVPSSSRLTLSGKTKSSNISAQKIFLQ